MRERLLFGNSCPWCPTPPRCRSRRAPWRSSPGTTWQLGESPGHPPFSLSPYRAPLGTHLAVLCFSFLLGDGSQGDTASLIVKMKSFSRCESSWNTGISQTSISFRFLKLSIGLSCLSVCQSVGLLSLVLLPEVKSKVGKVILPAGS